MWLAHIFFWLILLWCVYVFFAYLCLSLSIYLLFTNAFAHTHTYIYISYADEKLNEHGDACCASMSSSNPLISPKNPSI